jgi:hypothetical protein
MSAARQIRLFNMVVKITFDASDLLQISTGQAGLEKIY